MNVEGESYKEAVNFINTYLKDKLQSFEILELEEVSNIPEEIEITEESEETDSAEVIAFPGNKTIH